MRVSANKNHVINLANPASVEAPSENKKTVNAGALRRVSDVGSRVEQRKNMAKNQARRLINDAWEKDKKADDSLAEKIAKKESNKNDIYNLKSRITDVKKAHDELADIYGVEPDSQEQKDLELLEKYQSNKLGVFSGEFSDEEIARLKELQNEELTDYQKMALNYNDTMTDLKKQIEETEVKNIILDEEIYDAKIAELKNQNMLNANDAADKIMEAASKDVLGMLVQDGKEKIDEKAEEEKEKAEKLAEEKEEQQEKIDAAKEKKAELEEYVEEAREDAKEQRELLEDIIDTEHLDVEMSAVKSTGKNMEFALRDIDKILKKNNLINEDIKGIEIDLDW